jgi:vanillate O-demethylase ferredoxin subunit
MNVSVAPAGLLPRLKLDVFRITSSAGDVRIFECRHLGAGTLPPNTPGSHVDVYVSDGTARQYSLLPSGHGSYRFAVKLEAEGQGGSKYLHEAIDVGDVLEIGIPRNNFSLHEEANHTVLIAGGIGITPLYSMAKRLVEIGSSWELHYSSRAGRDALFADELSAMHPSNVLLYGGPNSSRLDVGGLIERSPDGAHFYCCGPRPLIEEFGRLGAQRPLANIHVEHFRGEPVAPLEAFKVKLKRSGKILQVPCGRALLDVLLDAGVDIPFSCREGVCGACEVGVTEGIPDHRDSVLSPLERAANKSIVACCSGSRTETLTLDL